MSTSGSSINLIGVPSAPLTLLFIRELRQIKAAFKLLILVFPLGCGGTECEQEQMKRKNTECPRFLESGFKVPNIRKIWLSPISTLEFSAFQIY